MSEADWDRLQYYSKKVKFFEFINEDFPPVHPSTYFRIGQLCSSALFPSLCRLSYFLGETSIAHIFLHLSPLLDSLELFNIRGFENTIVAPFLAILSSQMLRQIVLRNGELSAEVLKKSIVNFKQLRTLELSDAVIMSDFVLLEVLGTLPYLENLTLVANNPASYPAHAPENSNSQSGHPRYFEALESLRITGSFFLIRYLLGFIDSPCLKSIEIYPVVNQVRNELEPEDLFTPFMTIVTSKWSETLKNFVIYSDTHDSSISDCMILFQDLHNMETFRLDWWLKILEDDVISLAKSWPKLRTLNLNQTLVSLSTLGLIAENCPELRHLHIRLDTSTIPPLDTSNKNLRHNLENLVVGRAHPSSMNSISTKTILERQIKVTRHLNFIFPYLKSIEVQSKDVFWSGVRDLIRLCQDVELSRR